MRPADHSWRVDPLDERLPQANLAARLRVLKALQREYEIFLKYQQTVAEIDEGASASASTA